MSTWQRARTPDQVEERREMILAAAERTFAELGLDGASLNQIARTSEISKAAIHRYFESREAIFLAVLLDDYTSWIDEFVSTAQGTEADELMKLLTRTFFARERLGELFCALASVLEQNVSVETVVEFKLQLHEGIERVVPVFETKLGIDREQTYLLLTAFHFMTVGSWPATNPPPAVAEALARPELAPFCIDAEQAVTGMLEVMLRGMR